MTQYALTGALEYGVMRVLWELGTATTRQIHDRVGQPAGLAYTTTATVLDRLHAKGCCSRQRQGKTFSYQATIARETIDRARAQETISRLVGADPVPAIACLVEAIESLDPELLDELERVTAERRRERAGSEEPKPRSRHGS